MKRRRPGEGQKRGFEVPLDENRAVDPSPLPDALLDMWRSDEEPIEPVAAPSFKEDFRRRIVPLLDRIPPREADILELYFLRRKTERELSQIFGVTQAAISYRLKRGIERIRWLLKVPQFTADDLASWMHERGFPAADAQLLTAMHETTNVSESARRLGLSQNGARGRYQRLVRQLRAMAGLDPRAVPFADFFEAVQRDRIVLWEEKTLNGKGRFLPEELSERRDRVAALLRARRLPFSDIARAVGVTPQFVYAVAKSIGVPPPTRRRSDG